MGSLRRAFTRHGLSGIGQMCVILFGMIAGAVIVLWDDRNESFDRWSLRQDMKNMIQNEQLVKQLDEKSLAYLQGKEPGDLGLGLGLPAASSAASSGSASSGGKALEQEDIDLLKSLISEAVRSEIENNLNPKLDSLASSSQRPSSQVIEEPAAIMEPMQQSSSASVEQQQNNQEDHPYELPYAGGAVVDLSPQMQQEVEQSIGRFW